MTPDHPTPIALRTHSRCDPLVLWGEGIAADGLRDMANDSSRGESAPRARTLADRIPAGHAARFSRREKNMSDQFSVAIMGATGAVGQVMMEILAERNFPVGNLRLLASARSAGRTFTFRGENSPCRSCGRIPSKGSTLCLLRQVGR